MYLSMLIIGTKSHELIISQHNNDGAHSHKPLGFVGRPLFLLLHHFAFRHL